MMRHFARYRLNQFFVFTLIGLFLSGLISFSNLVPTQAAPTSARQLNEQGFQLLYQGDADEALSIWQKSTQLYKQVNDRDGVVGSTLNQTIAMQALGLNPRACQTIVETMQLPDWLCFSYPQTAPLNSTEVLQQAFIKVPRTSTTSIGLRLLGGVLRSLGKLPESQLILDQADHVATLAVSAKQHAVKDSSEQARIALSKGATFTLLSDQIRNNFLRTDDPSLQELYINKLNQAIEKTAVNYQNAIQLSKSPEAPIAIQATINSFSFVVDLGYWLENNAAEWARPRLNTQLSRIEAGITPQIQQLLQVNQFQFPSTVETISSQLKLAQALLKSKRVNRFARFWQESSMVQAQVESLIDQALTQSRKTNNLRFQSYAIGTRAMALEAMQKPKALVQSTYQQALSLAQAIKAPDVAYQWQQALARLYQDQNRSAAAQAYRSAIDSISQVRDNLLAVNPDVQFSFKEKVEPVYRDYIQLLSAQPQPNLREIVKINESLQLAELENYLGCGRLANTIPLEQLVAGPNHPTVVHIISLTNQTKTIIQTKPSTFYEYSSATPAIKLAADNLLTNLQSPSLLRTSVSADLLPYARSLYDQLIKPAKDQGILPKSGTLVFVLDSLLQNIPMGLLHDGNQFLIENYSISLAIGSQVQKPEPLSPNHLEALVAGLSKQSPSFQDPRAPQGLSPLPEVEFEVKSIRRSLSNSVELLNEQFTAERLQSEIESTFYPVVHITTHGQFSSDPSRTLLLAWDHLIDAPQLNRLLRSSTRTRQSAINLLVLSACQTAKGDPRSALGIAGIAAQAGARSTVATLWLVDADSTGVLMNQFYEGLKNNLPKAEALRQAQITLLTSDAFNHPYYWAGFVLVGNSA